MLKQRRKWLIAGLVTFIITASLGIALNSFAFGHGFQTERSVSRYVGFEAWSAVIFALGNFVTAGVTMMFLWELGERWKMPRIYYYMSFLMGLGLIWLSMCPVGYFDTANGKSTISLMHEFTSRMMFLMMMLVAGMLALRKKYNSKASRIIAAAYVVYGLICLAGYFTKSGWFVPYFMIYESLYIVAFDIVLLLQREKKEELAD